MGRARTRTAPRAPRALPRVAATTVLALSGTLLLLVDGTTWAPFGDRATGTGRPTAGTVDVVLNGDGDDNAAFAYAGGECNNLAVGESCTAAVTVRNAGTLAVTYNVRVVDSNDSCFTSHLTSEADLERGHDEQGDPHDDHEPGDSHTGQLVTVLDNDAEHCEGSTSRGVVTVTARQSPSPHPA